MFCCLGTSLAEDLVSPIELNNEQSLLIASEQMLLIEDEKGELTAEQVYHRISQGEGEPVFDKVPNFGVTNSAYWFYFRVNHQTPDDNWYLFIEHHLIKEVNLFQLDQKHWHNRLHSGTSRPWHKRRMDNGYFIHSIPRDNGSQTYLLRVLNQDPLIVPLAFLTETELQKKLNQSLWISGVFWGVLLALLAYNSFIYLSTHETGYLYYVLYLISFAGYLLVHEPWSHSFVFSDFPWLATHAIHLVIPLSVAMALLFVTHFLQLKNNLPAFHKFCQLGVLWSGLLLVSYGFIGSAIHSQLLLTSVLVFSVFILYAAIQSILQKNPDAPFFLLAWSVLIFGVVVTNLMYSNILSFNWFTARASHLGASAEMLLLSFALAASINRIRKEKMQSDQLYQKTLKENLTMLDKSNQIKDNFLNIISHELRTPLHGIRASLDLVLDKLQSESAKKEFHLLDSSTAEMERRITDLLVFTDLSSGKFKLNNCPFQLHNLADELEREFKPLAEDKYLGLQFSYDAELPEWVLGDEKHLLLICSQLLDNAIKFTSDGIVSIFFDLSKASQKQFNLMVTIKDTGVGFEQHLIKELDQAFVQADSSLHRDNGGLGLGLSLCRQLIVLMKGQLKYESEVNAGTSVTLEIPIIAVEKPTISPSEEGVTSNKAERPKQSAEILIVEDNQVNRLVIGNMVKHMGHHLSYAENGQIALDLCKQRRFDLILMDCQMPIMDGITATKLIREDSMNQQTPIVAVTANAMSSDNELCLAAGMNQHLAKPVRLAELTESINRWL